MCSVLDDYMCEGQMSLFDIPSPEEPQLLEIGQVIYTVIRGDVREETVVRTFPLERDRGYHTDVGVIWNSSIGADAFFTREEAETVAKKYLKEHEVILPNSIHPVEVRAWHYIRDVDGRDMVAFYSILYDGRTYIKEFTTYDHIIDFGTVEKARAVMAKKFCKDEFRLCRPDLIEGYVPMYKKMYKCRKGVNWDWAEAAYSGIEE